MKSEPIKNEKELKIIIDNLKERGRRRELILFMIGISTGLKMEDVLRLKVRNVDKGFIQIKMKGTGIYI